jgi:hypothetical protein
MARKKSKRPVARKQGKFCLYVHKITEARTPEEPYSRSRVVCFRTARKLKEAMRAATRWLRSGDDDAFFYDYKSRHFKRKSKAAKLSPREARRAKEHNRQYRASIPF